MVRKITAPLLLIVFLLNGAGFINIYQFSHDKTTRMLRKARLRNDKQLTVILRRGEGGLAKKGFKPINKREYLYRGRRYDIVGQEEKEDHTLVYLVHDSYEEELLSFLTSFFNTDSHDSRNQADSFLKKNINKQYIPVFYAVQKIGKEYPGFPKIQCTIPSVPYIERPFPPPQAA